MPSRLEIQCIRKTSRFEVHDRIHSVGGTDPSAGAWRISQRDAVTAIEDGTHSFYVMHGIQAVDVVVGISRWGFRYLKTVADDLQPDNLLELPKCP
jgi:hypothetical protein